MGRDHGTAKPTALLCHGPIAIASAIPKAQEFRAALVAGRPEEARRLAEGWQYAGYRMTIFSNDEEHYAEEHYMGGSKVPFQILLDEDFKAVDHFGIRGDLAKPATYILDKEGKVRFAYVGTSTADRPSLKALLKQLDAINGSPS